MRKERKKQQQNIGYARPVGLLCLLLGLLLAAVFLLAPEGGVGGFVAKCQQYLLGRGAFLLPFACLALAWQLLRHGRLLLWQKRTWAAIMVMLCFLGMAHHVFIPVGEELAPSTLPEGGGLVGGLLVLALHKLLGSLGTAIILGMLGLLCLLLLLPLTALRARLRSEKTVAAEELMPQTARELQPEPRQTAARFTPLPATDERPVQSGVRAQNVYNNADFGAFTKGLQKPTGLKRIFGTKSVYEQKEIKEELAKDPIQIPEWEQPQRSEVILRPIINYETGDGSTYVPDERLLEPEQPAEADSELVLEPAAAAFAEPESVAEVVAEAEPATTSAEPPAEHERAAASIVTGVELRPDDSRTLAEAAQLPQIFDSADKVQTAAASAAELAAGAEESGSAYRFPPLELLEQPQLSDPASYQQDIMDQCAVLEQTLADFKVRAKVIAVTRGPSVTRFELEPAPGVKVSSVVNLADDIALRLAAPGVRIEAPIPGKSAIGIEAPNTKNDTVCFREVVDCAEVRKEGAPLRIGLGKDISGNIITADLAKMPHLLVAGSTGSGKSVCINTIIAGLLYKARPEEVKLILVDPKVVELSNYNGIPHLLTPVVTEPKKAASALHWAVAEMERRYKAFAESHVREINSYNATAAERMPFIVIIIDELSDLMMVAKVDVEDAILRLAQKARAAGIHLILATQRPSVDVITGIVKANIPSRVAFAVSSQTDSRTIIDTGGAEKLLGKGDMLFSPIGMNKPVRVQGAFVTDGELNRIVDFIIKQSIPVTYSEEVTAQELECDSKNNTAEEAGLQNADEDELFPDALRLVLDMGQASASMLQRRFRIGYTRAARLVDNMEELGIVGQAAGSKPREVIMARQEAEERFLSQR